MLIVLMGVSGSGKTTVGKLLAAQLGWPLYDADDFQPPANVAKMRAGIPLTDADRAPWLDALHRMLSGLAEQGRSAILACSALKQAYRACLSDGVPDVRIVYLRGDRALLERRLAGRSDHYMPASLLQSQLDTLEEPRAALVVDVDAPPEAIAERIRRDLNARAVANPATGEPHVASTQPHSLRATDLDTIRTARLVLTRIVDADFPDLLRMHRNVEVMRTLGGVRSEATTADVLRQLAAHWEAHGFGYWMASHAETRDFVGRGGLRRVVIAGIPEVEIGYALMPEYWGQGYATELARECARIAFEVLGRDDVVAFTLPTNQRSRAVMERLGMTFEREMIWMNLPHVLYRLTAAAWRSRRADR
jgi:carbohydrate kinase (thermoresistant glucokinase family)